MKKKSMMYVVIAAIATMFLTSCERYTKYSSLESEKITGVQWNHVISDSVKKDIIHYFTVIGEENSPKISEAMIHKQFGILHVPDSLIKNLPMYYKCFYGGFQMISERKVQMASGPTLWNASRVTFTLKLMEPVNFDQATVQITTRESRIFWQVVLVIIFIICGFFSFLLVNDDWNVGSGILLFVVTIGILVSIWFYVPYFISGVLTLLLTAAGILQIIYVVRNLREQKKAKEEQTRKAKEEQARKVKEEQARKEKEEHARKEEEKKERKKNKKDKKRKEEK